MFNSHKSISENKSMLQTKTQGNTSLINRRERNNRNEIQGKKAPTFTGLCTGHFSINSESKLVL